jgi:hypothetical protein
MRYVQLAVTINTLQFIQGTLDRSTGICQRALRLSLVYFFSQKQINFPC